jgi:hypothetical protein
MEGSLRSRLRREANQLDTAGWGFSSSLYSRVGSYGPYVYPEDPGDWG